MGQRAVCSFFPFLVIPLSPAPLLAEDVKLREQAIHLMEVANAVSLTGGLGNYEQTVTFTVHDVRNGSVKEGTFSELSAGAGGGRDEFTLGEYHAIRGISGGRLFDSRTGEEQPEIRELFRC